MSASYFTDITTPASQPKSIRIYDLYIDGQVFPGFDISDLTPGPPNTFLYTDAGNNVIWNTIQNSDIPDPLVVNEIDPTRIRDVANSVGTAGQVLQKTAGNNLVWGNLNTPLGDINNITIFQTSAGASTSVAPGATEQIIYNSFFDSTATLSLLTWDIANTRTGFTMLGTYLVTLTVNITYTFSTNGAYTISLESNNADVNGRVYSKVFTAPALGSTNSVESFQIAFVLDQRTGATPWVKVRVNNNANSTSAIAFNNTEPNCKFSVILLRTP